ncbi:putative TLC domain-containing protein [Seiridium cardinale]|uniref:TLC domain-containing protein n=1 Tax=Seiridium cardinale TaxID=138064 RepID=A0ABR2XMR1_9PEZI
MSKYVAMLNRSQGDIPLFTHLEPVFLERDGVLLCVLVQLVAMYLVGALASFVIPLLSPRVNSLPERRQKQLAVAIPVILLKATVMWLITDTLHAAPGFWHAYSAPTTSPPVDYRFQTLYFVAISYVFEILQRPSSAELVAHHLYLQALPFYYWFWLRHQSPAHADLAMRFFELMVLLGPGATDIVSDVTFLLYYCAPRSRTGLTLTRCMSSVATVMRAVQWIVLIGYGYTKYTEATNLLSSIEKGTFVVSVILWVWTEVDEILKIKGMVGKFSNSLEKKDV